MFKLTEKDKKILEILQTNCKKTVKEISKLTKIKPSTVHDRIKRLERKGIIKNYVAILDDKKTGNITFYFYVKFKPGSNFMLRDTKAIMENKHIQEICLMDGEYHILMKCVFPSIEEFGKFHISFRKKYGKYIQSTISSVVYVSEKKSTEQPINL